MIRNNNKYKWCTSFNNGNGAWVFHLNDSHDEWENKQGNKLCVRFSNPATNAKLY